MTFRTLRRPACLRNFSRLGALVALAIVIVPPLLPQLACVTVNVNFPESAVQNATDDYVKDLYRAKERGKPTATPAAKPSARLAWPSLFAPAWAGELFNVTSAKAVEIRGKLAAHLEEILGQKRGGAIGETNDGHLVLRGKEKLKPLLAEKIEKLVALENQLRSELYREALAANGITQERLKDLEHSFARSFQAESPSGTWVQDADGKWEQKP